MSDLRPKGSKIKLGEKEYGMLFSLNAIDDIQDHFNISISELGDLFQDEKKQIKNLRYIITVLLNEYIDFQNDENGGNAELLDERYVGRHVNGSNIGDLIAAIYGSFSDGAIETDEADETDPNLKSE